jgi:hypothetical protein
MTTSPDRLRLQLNPDLLALVGAGALIRAFSDEDLRAIVASTNPSGALWAALVLAEAEIARRRGLPVGTIS